LPERHDLNRDIRLLGHFNEVIALSLHYLRATGYAMQRRLVNYCPKSWRRFLVKRQITV
jgi:hypothetical protein